MSKTDTGGTDLKKDVITPDRVKLLEKEIATLTEQIEMLSKKLDEMKDVKDEIKGLKLFLGRVYPEFKTWFPEIMQKVYKNKKK